MTVTNIEIKRTRSYGHYTISGEVQGEKVKTLTTDSEAFDYLHDEDSPEKQAEAIAHCEMKLIEVYENL